MSEFIPDCLVLKIEEICNVTDWLDTTIYVLYDKKEHNYVVRGQRKTSDICYSFICEEVEELADFISFVVDKHNYWNYILYNYDNLPNQSDDITYDFFSKHDSIDYELAGYDKLKYSRKGLLTNLRMLRNIYNNFY
jgi:hypothetical protein